MEKKNNKKERRVKERDEGIQYSRAVNTLPSSRFAMADVRTGAAVVTSERGREQTEMRRQERTTTSLRHTLQLLINFCHRRHERKTKFTHTHTCGATTTQSDMTSANSDVTEACDPE